MIQDTNTQASNPNNDTIEEVNEQQLQAIAGGCTGCHITALASKAQSDNLYKAAGKQTDVNASRNLAALSLKAQDLAAEAKNRPSSLFQDTSTCKYCDGYNTRFREIMNQKNGMLFPR